MNTYNFTQKETNARFFIALTVILLLLSAFPSAFIVAEAASTGITLSKSLATTLVDEQVNFLVQTVKVDSATAGTYVALSDEAGGAFFTGTIAGACNATTPDADAMFAITDNKGVCYSNSTAGEYTVTAQLLTGIGGDPIGLPETIVITVIDPSQPTISDVTLCKYDENKAPLADWQLSLTESITTSLLSVPTAPENNFNGTTSADGCVTFTGVPYGEYVVGEILKPNWTNVSGLGETLVVDNGTESFELINKYEEPVVQTYKIAGYKYQADGLSTTTKSGWSVRLEDGSNNVIAATTTDFEGYYFFEVTAGSYEVHEDMVTDWTQLYVFQDSKLVETDSVVESCVILVPDESDYSCDFYNKFNIKDDEDKDGDENEGNNQDDDEDGNGDKEVGRGHKKNSHHGKPEPKSRVLGISTKKCGQYLHDYMKQGQENSVFEVKKLQYFLTGQGFYAPATGLFDDLTNKSVKAFQLAYKIDVLRPWLDARYVKNDEPTGYVYQLTKWKINNMVCPNSEPLPRLIP